MRVPILVLALAGIVSGAAGQTSPVSRTTGAKDADPPAFAETVRSEYVLLPAIVEDSHGRFVDGLQKQSFRVTVDGTPISLDSFDRDDTAPISFAFLMDVSGSMETAGKLEWAKKALRWILRHSRPGDDFSLFAFSEGQVRLVSDFGSSTRDLLARLKELRPEGDTALLDAVAATPSQMVKGKNGKRAIVLFTDGVDNSSRLSREELEGVLEQLSIPVYPVGLVTRSVFDRGESPAAGYDVATLESLAEWSGGKMFLTEKLEDMGRVISRINREVRRQYLLGFSPSGTGAARYRSVSVSVAKSGSWRVRTRRGYHGTPPRGGD